MNLKLSAVLIAAAVSLPVFADAPAPQKNAISNTDIDAAAAAVLDAQQTPPTEPGSDEMPQPATTEELAGRLESITEAFTEARNTLENLSRMRLSGYIQPQYLNDERSVNELTGAAATRNRDQFAVRRARIKFTYQFSPTSRFILQPDFGTGGAPTLKDGYVEYTEPWTSWRNTLTAGQFNWPFGFEIMYSSSSREMPERTLVVRTLFPGERDRGAMLSGVGFGERFNYRIAVVNGTGTTQTFDFNKRKDIVGRVGATFGPLDVGASVYRGSELVSLAGLTRGREFDRDRAGIDFQWVTPLPGLGVRGEYIRGVQPPAPGAAISARAADVDGWYLYVIQNVGTRHQFVLRGDEYDPNADVDDNATLTLGGSYVFHWDANSKFMFAYERPDTEGFDIDDDVFTLRYQYSF